MGGAPKEVIDLIERFERNIESYKGQGYNEAQVRKEFIDPFFDALGWDIANKGGTAEAYKDVIHEDAIKIGGTTKAPDYCFRVGGTRKFFLEAKKPSVDIKSDISPAYQLRRYAWSAKLPLSILTDFEEFAVYDCQMRPSPDDKPSAGRIMLFTYKDYADKWEQIANIFSKEAVYKGLFDKYASEKTTKRGTTTVDKEFLAEIEEWRNELAKNIAIRNGKLSVYDLNFAVQKTIDRILFLRICEDRGIERSEQLLGLISGSRIYPRLFELFEKADEKYNSGIFHFRREKDRPEGPDELSAKLKINDDVLTRILKDLYYPRSPYEFSVMPAEILGQVYEQFLGKVIRLTESHQAKVEEKPEVKKAGGVYYTPSYIVDYIVKNTVGKLCENKTPKQIEKLKILDPACGSGSFLIGAYQYLLDFHRDWYVSDGMDSRLRGNDTGGLPRCARNDTSSSRRRLNKPVYQGKGKQWFLTIDEKKRILLNNIYGVDIDSQAVEVTKLSLLLKVLENETQESLRLFHERALPDLGNNIKCGNSLIGPDFYQSQQLTLFDDQQQIKINAFDWQKEFPEILTGKTPGFDAVIGNPPYIRMETFTTIKNYLRTIYSSYGERSDLYTYFLEKGLNLLNPIGTLGFIVSNKFIKAKYGYPLRQLLYSHAIVKSIADFAGANVFKNATVRTVVMFISRKNVASSATPTIYIPVPDAHTLEAIDTGHFTVMDHVKSHACHLPANALTPTEWRLVESSHSALIDKLRKANSTLSDFTGQRAIYGVKTGLNNAFIVDKTTRSALIRKHPSATTVLRPILFGKDVRRYHTSFAHRYIIYLHPEKQIHDFPSIYEHLLPFKGKLEKRAGPQRWFELQQPAIALLKLANLPKIIYPIIADECRFTIDTDNFLINDKAFLLSLNDPLLLGILNSSLGYFYFSSVCAALEGGTERYLEFRAQYVDLFPMPSEKSVETHRVKLTLYVNQILELNKKLAGIKNPEEKTRIQRQIDPTDEQIDKLVYDLYGLTKEEIEIVEG